MTVTLSEENGKHLHVVLPVSAEFLLDAPQNLVEPMLGRAVYEAAIKLLNTEAPQ